MKTFLSNMYNQVMDLNKSNMLIFINENPNAKMLDLGCDNREWSCSLGEKQTLNIFLSFTVHHFIELSKI